MLCYFPNISHIFFSRQNGARKTVSFYLWKFSSGFTDEVSRATFLKMLEDPDRRLAGFYYCLCG